MSPRVRRRYACVAATAVVIAFVSALQAAQQPSASTRPVGQPPAPAGPKASEKYMNLKVLGDLPPSSTT
jgi:hypothetical protein